LFQRRAQAHPQEGDLLVEAVDIAGVGQLQAFGVRESSGVEVADASGAPSRRH